MSSSTLSIGGAAAVAVFAITSLMAGQRPDPVVVDRTVDDDTTVFVASTVLRSPFVPNDPAARFAEALLPVDGGLIAVGRQGVGGATATVIGLSGDAPLIGDVVYAEQTIAADASTVIVVDDARFRVLELDPDGGLTEVGGYLRSDEATFGSEAALSGDTLAITRSSDDGEPELIEVFDLANGTEPIVAFAPGLDRLSLAIDTSGDVVAISGVRDRADVGEVQFFRRSGDVWLVDAAFDAVGGGGIVASPNRPDSFLVQRNGYLALPVGPWTMIGPDESGALAVGRELPVQAATVALGDGLMAFGLPGRETVLTFSTDPSDDGDTADFRHAQTLVAPIPVDDEGAPTLRRPAPASFGTALAFVDGRLFVGGPGAEIEGVDDEGELFSFAPTLGPAGCTITGTEGDDTLNGTTGDDVICGLGGDDLIRGNVGFDRIYGGPGDDDLSGDADDDLIVGGDGSDRIAGGAGDDRLVGGDGSDAIYGGAGGDRIDGGPGRDACYGGADIDTFAGC